MNYRPFSTILILLLFLTACQPVDTSMSTPAPQATHQPMTLPAPTQAEITPASTFLPEPSLEFLKPCEDISGKGIPGASPVLRNSHILYLAYNDQTVQPEVRVISLKEMANKKLHNPEFTNYDFGFLKDGYHFLMVQSAGRAAIGDIDNTQIQYVEVDEILLSHFRPYSVLWQRMQMGDPKFLDPGIGSYLNGDEYSPDGKKIAAYSLGYPALVITDVTTTRGVAVMDTPVSESGQADSIEGEWTDDGTEFIFFRTTRDETDQLIHTQLFSVDRQGQNLHPLSGPFVAMTINAIKISPDQKQLVFELEELKKLHRDLIGFLERSTGQIRIFESGSQIRGLAMGGVFTWSPDGQYIAYLTQWDQVDIRVMSVETGKTYCITDDSKVELMMDWK